MDIAPKWVLENLIVVKRSGQRTDFNGEKIALAIKKAFDSTDHTYSPEAINKTYEKILKIIENRYQDRKTIKIEDIQDIIEEQLKHSHFDEVYETFKTYREQRAISRETFVIKQQHKFLKAIETLGLSNYTEGSSFMETKTSIEVLETFGKTIAEEFAKAYLLDNKYVRMQDSGLFYLENLAFLPMGTTASMQWDLDRINKLEAFKSTHEEEDLREYITDIFYLLENNQKDQYGMQAIESFDHVLSPIVLRTFIKKWASTLKIILEVNGVLEWIPFEKIERELDKLEHIPSSLRDIPPFFERMPTFTTLLEKTYTFAFEETAKEIRKAMILLIQNMNHEEKENSYSVSLGTNSTYEGKLITKIFLECLYESKEKEPTCLLKIKEPIEELFSFLNLTIEKIETIPHLKFIFLNTSYNKKVYNGEYNTEVGYFADGERVCDDITPGEAQITGGKGVLSYSYINLPRIALKYMSIANKESRIREFYTELEQVLDTVCDANLERFEIQCTKHCFNFPFLIEKGIWLDGDKVKENDRLRKILKHGTFSIRFTGLAETVYALADKSLEEKEGISLAYTIIEMMRDKLNFISSKNNLNFVLSGIGNPKVEEQFMQIDKAIYGKVKGVTDKKSYTESFHLNRKEDFTKTIEREEKFHTLTNGGHITYLPLPKKEKDLYLVFDKIYKSDIGILSFTK